MGLLIKEQKVEDEVNAMCFSVKQPNTNSATHYSVYGASAPHARNALLYIIIRLLRVLQQV